MLCTSPVMSSMPAPAALAPPAPAPHTSPKAPADRDGESFSKALNDAAEPEAPVPGAKPANAHRPRGRATESADGRHPAAPPQAGAAAGAADGTGPAGQAHADTPAADDSGDHDSPVTPGDVCGLLADLHSRHVRMPSASGSAAHGAATEPLDARAAAHGARPALALPAGDGGAADRRALAHPAPLGKADPATAPSTADAAPLATPSERHAARIEAPSFSVPTPAAQPTAATTAAAEAPRAEATLSAPLSSPDFASQLGATLTTFVRDGVGHAQLHLNPAEMGPVSVQIQLDGQNAQVLLGADHATTRQALEQSLPLLASSLREAGLTLAGGGVFEQGQQGRDGGQPGPGGEKARTMSTLPPQPLLPAGTAPPRRGVVDLVA